MEREEKGKGQVEKEGTLKGKGQVEKEGTLKGKGQVEKEGKGKGKGQVEKEGTLKGKGQVERGKGSTETLQVLPELSIVEQAYQSRCSPHCCG